MAVMRSAQHNLARTTSAVAPETRRSARRRSKSRPEASRLRGSLCAVLLVGLALLAYVSAYATLTLNSYRHDQLRTKARNLQVQRRTLESQVAERQRLDRILPAAKELGMQPRDKTQYVAVMPRPAPHVVQQASARR